MIMTRSESAMSARMTCSIRTTVTPGLPHLADESSTSSISPGFRPPTGSSRISSWGSVAIADAIISRFLSNSDNGPATAPSLSSSPTNDRRLARSLDRVPVEREPRHAADRARSRRRQDVAQHGVLGEDRGDLEGARDAAMADRWDERSWISSPANTIRPPSRAPGR